MKTATPQSPWKRTARETIQRVIAENVHGPVQCLAAGDVLELRAKLRDAYPFGEKKHYPYRIWCEEVRDALGFEVKPSLRTRKKMPVRLANDILPSMRAWAIERGLAVEESANGSDNTFS